MSRFTRFLQSTFQFSSILFATAGCAFIWSSSVSQSQEPAKNKPAAEKLDYAIALHGGAGSAPSQFDDAANERRYKSLEKALQIGVDILKRGGTSLEAVENVVVFLENDPQFNAGVGAVFTATGGHELDASIMNGKNLACGSVAGVSHVKNPIILARLVMTKSSNVLLTGAGAEEFGKLMNVEMVDTKHFDTEAARKAWGKKKEQEANKQSSIFTGRQKSSEMVGSYQGTVGCVAFDSEGNLAAATSTGGLTNKRFGRVGDSPIIGAGTYADNESCAVSCTGTGEEFIRFAVAHDVSARVKYAGVDVETAVRDVLTKRLQPDDGGIIAVSRTGQITTQYSTEGMGSGAADSTGRFEINWKWK